MTEEQRAADFRASLVRRRAAERARYQLLAGSAVAARAVRDGWQAFRDYIRERENCNGEDESRDA